MKKALTLDGQPHPDISHVEAGTAAGWRVVYFADRTLKRMTARELQAVYGGDPFRNLNPCSYQGGNTW